LRLDLNGYEQMSTERRREFDRWLVTSNLMHLHPTAIEFHDAQYVTVEHMSASSTGYLVGMGRKVTMLRRDIFIEKRPPEFVVEYCT
jgi:hypothetical protein